ncbi:MAG: hypothetical protein E7470_08450 [Ruminococcaceae bacterium]|nr:hypothetical protein [Oscillospiraceae bacterium]
MKFSEDLTAYRAVPFWSWNDKLEPEELRRQIRWMKEMGMGGFFMHARGGLKTEYLSEEWMKAVDACADEAQKIGMHAWAYDENGWPSGFCGGLLLEEEENRDRYLSYKIGDFDPDAYASYPMDGEALVRVSEPCGAGEYLNVYLNVSISTVDIMNPVVVRKFLDSTHELYKERYGDRFSELIKGFFTDEPQIFRWGTAFSLMLPEYFEKHYGQDIRDYVGLLFVEKQGYRQFRHRYWRACQQLMLKSFGEQVYQWCDDNGVKLTGHYIEETALGFQVCCCGGIMPFYKHMHIPGIDWLGRFHTNTLPAHQINSVAHQYGKKQILTECFAACGWEVSPMELKCLAELQYVGGLNLMCQHLLPYSEHGQRKRDYPHHFSDISPWVREYFKVFNDHFTHLGYLIANSEEQINVAVLHPVRSAYLDYKRDADGPGFGVETLDKIFAEQVKMLANHHLGYHFLDETLLAEDGFVRDGKIGCGLCSYEYLILPTVYTIDETTEKLLREYVEQGGKVLLLDGKPSYVEGEVFDFGYLQSNVTMEEILDAQPYRADRTDLPVHSHYRTYNGEPYLCVQNYSADHDCEVTFDFADIYTSFEQLDLQTLERTPAPLTVKLRAGEMKVLFLSRNIAPLLTEQRNVHLGEEYQLLSHSGNYLTLDTVCYSKDGVDYSEPLPCMGVLQQLLEERYAGKLYLKYQFHVRTKPQKMSLLAEVGSLLSAQVNGQPITFDRPSGLERNFFETDIAGLVKKGNNEIVMCLDYYQTEDVYYALFGENVTESLLNCLVYKTDIEAVYLYGDFGVYEQEGFTPGQKQRVLLGKAFYIDALPETITNPITDGMPFFAGTLKLRQKLMLEDSNVSLEFKGKLQAIKVFVNGQEAGLMLLDNRLDISKYAVVGENTIELELIVSNRNLLGPHHAMDEEPNFVGPFTYTMKDTWKNGKSTQYRDSYSFVVPDLC